MSIVHASMRAAGTAGFVGGIWFKTECERGPCSCIEPHAVDRVGER